MAGILSVIKLAEAGITDVTVYEKADRVGGTWRENTYPGLSCDVPSHLYSYSFALSSEWSHRFAPGSEIQAYFERVADDNGVVDRVRFGDAVTRCEFVDGRWELSTASGHRDTVDVVIAATGRLAHYVLARMTAWLDEETGLAGTFPKYVDRNLKHPYEVEHIVADIYERHQSEFPTQYDFEEHRNRFGGLVLLPKDFNASYGAMPYAEKVEHYVGQNLLARSLNPAAYKKNPSFLSLIDRYSLDFQAHPEVFDQGAMDQRQSLYRQIAEVIWDPARHGFI
jgi:hypothetical protein